MCGEAHVPMATVAVCTYARRSVATPTAAATQATSLLRTARPVKTWMNVPQGWPSVLMAASTPRDPSSACATQAMSWVPTAGSATGSRWRL